MDKSNEEPNYEAAAYVSGLNRSDTFRYEFAVDRKGQLDSFHYDSKARIEKLLRLSSLEKGFDSIQIRINYACVMGDEMLVILTNKHNKWSAEISKLTYHYNYTNEETGGVLDSMSRTIKYCTPESGWRNFINKLFELKILSIEDNYKIPGFYYAMPTDGCGIVIEIATKNVYRFYSYDNPDMYSGQYWQAKNVLDIVRFINKELAIKTRYPNEEEYSEQIIDSTKQPKIPEIELQDIKH